MVELDVKNMIVKGFSQYHFNTAQMAKQLGMKEPTVDRIISEWLDQKYMAKIGGR